MGRIGAYANATQQAHAMGMLGLERLHGWRGNLPDRLRGVVRCHAVEVEMIRTPLWHFGIAFWGALGIWFCAGLPWL